MKRFNDLLKDCLPEVAEVMPWDLAEDRGAGKDMVIVDVREPYEYDAMHIEGSLNVPRGILESAVEWGYEETVPDLVQARDRPVVLVCRSGNRSLLAARTLALMGYTDAVSLKLGLRGWKDDDQPLVDAEGNPVPPEAGDDYFTPRVAPEQMGPR